MEKAKRILGIAFGILLASYGTLGLAGGLIMLPTSSYIWYTIGSMMIPGICFIGGLYLIGNSIKKKGLQKQRNTLVKTE